MNYRWIEPRMGRPSADPDGTLVANFFAASLAHRSDPHDGLVAPPWRIVDCLDRNPQSCRIMLAEGVPEGAPQDMPLVTAGIVAVQGYGAVSAERQALIAEVVPGPAKPAHFRVYYVAPGFRGAGTGETLVTAGLSAAWEMGATSVVYFYRIGRNESTRVFLLNHGFSPTGKIATLRATLDEHGVVAAIREDHPDAAPYRVEVLVANRK